MKMQCFSLFHERDDSIGIAESRGSADFRLTYGKEFIREWKTVDFDLVEGELVDYQLNNIGWPLCSRKLRSGIEEVLAGCEAIQWLPTNIISENGDSAEYFVLHVYRRDNVLDMRKSIFSDDHLVKPVLNASEVKHLNANVFATPFDSVRIYVRELVKAYLIQLGISGVKFLKAPMG
jgi:hypothetical protein